MRAVLQRVTGASVHVNDRLVSRIGPGIVALIGIGVDDTVADVAPLSQRILHTKLWNEGLSANDIPIPHQYQESESVQAENIAVGDVPSSNATDVVTRSEQVWEGKPWKTNVMDLGGEILCISQFTLHARLSKGTKPDFHKSMSGEGARSIYSQLLERLGELYQKDRIKDGAFGEMMQCSLTNDGPVTILIDTQEKK